MVEWRYFATFVAARDQEQIHNDTKRGRKINYDSIFAAFVNGALVLERLVSGRAQVAHNVFAVGSRRRGSGTLSEGVYDFRDEPTIGRNKSHCRILENQRQWETVAPSRGLWKR